MGNFTSYDASASEFNNLSISYANGASNGVQLAPALRAIAANGDEIENMVSIFYFNGVEWLTLGSSTDKANMAVAAKAKFAGKYQLRIAAPATDFTFYGVMPRIITPNNDGQNDRALFRYANPKARNISIEIFDLRGALVKDIGETNATSDAQGEYIYWDAKDNSGNIVPVGVYIYQLKGAGKVVNGTIVVAR